MLLHEREAEAHVRQLQAGGAGAREGIDAGEAEALRGFVRDGYLVLEDGIEDSLVDRALSDMQRAVDAGYQGWLVVEAEQDPAVAPSYEYAQKGYQTLRGLVDSLN